MKNTFVLLSIFGVLPLFKAQVGVNTVTPAATLDVVAKTTGASAATPEGLITPRLTIADLNAKTAAYGTLQTGTLIYVTDASNGSPAGQTLNIIAIGYYYFDGSAWQKISNGAAGGNNIYTGDGTVQTNRTVAMNDKTLNFSTATPKVNQFSVDGSTLSVDTMNDRLGLATSVPGSTLDVKGSVATQYTAITSATYTVLDTDNYLSYAGTTASTFTLPAGSASVKGREYIIRNSSTSSVTLTVNVAGGTNIDVSGTGGTSVSVPKGSAAYFKATGNTSGTTWVVTVIGSATTSKIVGNGLYRTTSSISYANPGSLTYNSTSFTGYIIVPFGGASGEVTVPNDGNYLATVRWWGITDNVSTGWTSAYLRLVKKDGVTGVLSTLDEIEYYTPVRTTSDAFTFSVNLLGASLKANDKLLIYIRPSAGNGKWITGNVGTTTVWNPSLLITQQ